MSVESKEEIKAVFLQLDVEEKQTLFLMLAADGTVNRLGRGTIDNEDNELFVGTNEDKLFESLMLDVDDKLLELAGTYRDSNLEGAECKLQVVFQTEDDSIGIEFVYGAESQGPPTEICDLVVAGIDLTDPWYERQIRNSQNIA